MKKKTKLVFKKIENQREEILKQYEQLTTDQLRFNPSPGRWNLLQVLRHLVTAEKMSLIYIQRKMRNHKNIPKAGLGAFFRFKILKYALILPIKYKAPKFAEVREDYPDFETMISEWDTVRSDMLDLIENSKDEILAKALYKHPRAGLLNVKQALEFIEIHTAHHRKQMDRLINIVR